MKLSRYFGLAIGFATAAVVLGGATLVIADANKLYMQWDVHQKDRPQPPVVTPGTPSTQDKVGTAPSDAIVLFDGTNKDAFHNGKGGELGWKILEDGALSTVNRSTGGCVTKQAFGDIQLHVEFRTPESQAKRTGQGKGNSGIFLMGKYEIQVLNNFNNETYPDGMAGSLYGQCPPMVNPARDINEWQTYDIIWRRPHFNEDGSVKTPAYVTILQNGVVVQDNQELLGPCVHKRRTAYKAHADKLPISFQNHGEECHYRNIWVRELPSRDNPRPYETK